MKTIDHKMWVYCKSRAVGTNFVTKSGQYTENRNQLGNVKLITTMNLKMKILATILLLPLFFLNFDFGLANSCRTNPTMQKMSCCVTVVHCDSDATQISPPACDCQISKAPAKSPPIASVVEAFTKINHFEKWQNAVVPLTRDFLNNSTSFCLSFRINHSPNILSEVKIYDLNSSYLI